MNAPGEAPWRLGDVLFVFSLAFLLASSAALVLRAGAEAEAVSEQVATALLLPLSPLFLGGACLGAVALRTSSRALEALRRLWGRSRRLPRQELALGAGLGVVATVGQVVIIGAVSAVLDVPVDEVQVPLRAAARDPALRPMLVLGAVVLAPFAEELFFRGMAYRALRQRVGVPLGVVLSAAFFAVVHLSWDAPIAASVLLFAVIFALGVALAWLFERRGSLFAPMAMHATFNLLSVAALLSTQG